MRHSEHREHEHTYAHKKVPNDGSHFVLPPRKETEPMKSAALVITVLSAACVNSSTLQTAKALDPGKQRALVGGAYYASPSLDADASEASGSDVSLALPYMELGYRRGIVEKVEVGAKVTVPGTAGIDGKYELLDDGKFAVAAGLGMGYLKM